jgi:anti-sigma B factor antagonist
MQLLTEHHSGYTLARPQISRLDAASAPALRSATADLANQGQFRVVLDLTGVEFVDSSGLGALIHMHKTLEPQGRLALCNVDPKVAQLFKVTRLERVFTIAANADAAAALVKQ